MPHVIVKLWPGKSEQQKTHLAETIAKDVMSILHYGEESVSVAIEEVRSQDWAQEVYKPDIQQKWDNTCPNCQYGYQSSCEHREWISTAQAPLLRVPLADGTLVPTPEVPSDDMVPSLLALSDVMGTGWFATHAANVKPGSTVVVVGDGAVGLLGVLSAKQMGADRILVM